MRRPDGAPGLVVVPGGFDPKRSLGWQVVDWIESMLCHGPGDLEGEPIAIDDEMASFIVMAYGLDDAGARLVRWAVLSRPKGRAKSEIAGAIACVEAVGPCRFDHWAEPGEVSSWGYRFEPGEPVGRPVRSPLLRCLATEEGQAGNTYDNVRVMLEKGAVADVMDGLDVGITRTFLPGSGEVRPCTAGSASKDGGKESWACADETHLYVLPELVQMYDTVSRNLRKRKLAQPWLLETTTAFVEGAGSVAESSMDHARAIVDGARNRGLLVDHRCGEIGPKDWSSDRKLAAALRDAYGPASTWMDIDGLVAEIRKPKTREADARRYFLNEPARQSDESWLPVGAWQACAGSATFDPELPVVVGVDMALKHDSIAVVGVQEWPDGVLRVQHRIWFPEGNTIDVAAVENQLRDWHRRWRVREVAYDPAFFERSAQALADDGLPMVEFPQSAARMVPACQVAYEAICSGRVVHDGSPSLEAQVVAAVPRETESGWRLSKGKSKKKIDAAVALVMAVARALAPNGEPEHEVFAY